MMQAADVGYGHDGTVNSFRLISWHVSRSRLSRKSNSQSGLGSWGTGQRHSSSLVPYTRLWHLCYRIRARCVKFHSGFVGRRDQHR